MHTELQKKEQLILRTAEAHEHTQKESAALGFMKANFGLGGYFYNLFVHDSIAGERCWILGTTDKNNCMNLKNFLAAGTSVFVRNLGKTEFSRTRKKSII